MFCIKCGNESADTDLFCISCGEKLQKPEPVVEPEIAKSGLEWPKETLEKIKELKDSTKPKQTPKPKPEGGLYWPEKTLEKIDELKKLNNSKPVKPLKQKEKSTQEPERMKKDSYSWLSGDNTDYKIIDKKKVDQEPEPVVEPEPSKIKTNFISVLRKLGFEISTNPSKNLLSVNKFRLSIVLIASISVIIGYSITDEIFEIFFIGGLAFMILVGILLILLSVNNILQKI